MRLLASILTNGLRKGFRSLLNLTRWVFPLVLLLSLVQHTGPFLAFTRLVSPLTQPLGLPGAASLMLLTGLFINKFAGISGLAVLSLTHRQFFVAAVFIALAHNVVVELAITWQSRLPVVRVAAIRVAVAYVVAFAAHMALLATNWLADAPVAGAVATGAAAGAAPAVAIRMAVVQALKAEWNLAIYLVPTFVIMEALTRWKLMAWVEAGLRPLTGALGLEPPFAPAVVGGLLLGVATGAGVISEVLSGPAPAVRSRTQVWRLNLFLLLFHSLIEDTVMFSILPVPILAVAAIRFGSAFAAARLVPAPGAAAARPVVEVGQ